MQLTSADQALDDADVFGADFGPAEQPVLPTYGNRKQDAFQVVGAQRHITCVPTCRHTLDL